MPTHDPCPEGTTLALTPVGLVDGRDPCRLTGSGVSRGDPRSPQRSLGVYSPNPSHGSLSSRGVYGYYPRVGLTVGGRRTVRVGKGGGTPYRVSGHAGDGLVPGSPYTTGAPRHVCRPPTGGTSPGRRIRGRQVGSLRTFPGTTFDLGPWVRGPVGRLGSFPSVGSVVPRPDSRQGPRKPGSPTVVGTGPYPEGVFAGTLHRSVSWGRLLSQTGTDGVCLPGVSSPVGPPVVGLDWDVPDGGRRRRRRVRGLEGQGRSPRRGFDVGVGYRRVDLGPEGQVTGEGKPRGRHDPGSKPDV